MKPETDYPANSTGDIWSLYFSSLVIVSSHVKSYVNFSRSCADGVGKENYGQ
jgi:hypothetical protein